MPVQPPAMIEEMRTLYFADARPYTLHLKKYMPKAPHWLVIVFYEEDKSYCILGTDDAFENWEQYTNYVFKDLPTALDFPHVIFRIDDFPWRKA